MALVLKIPGPTIGGAIGFVVDKHHRHVFPRFPQQVSGFVRANCVVDSTVGALRDRA